MATYQGQGSRAGKSLIPYAPEYASQTPTDWNDQLLQEECRTVFSSRWQELCTDSTERPGRPWDPTAVRRTLQAERYRCEQAAAGKPCPICTLAAQEGPSVAPPSARSGHTATYVPSLHCVVVLFGCNIAGDFNDVFCLDLRSGKWLPVPPPAGPIPSPRYAHTANLLRDGETLLICGGQNARAECATVKDQSPAFSFKDLFRWGHSMNTISAFWNSSEDSEGRYFLMVAGCVNGRETNSCCVVDSLTGECVAYTQSMLRPPPRRRHVTACYKAGEFLFLHGGRVGANYFAGDLWVLHVPSGRWQPIYATHSAIELRRFYADPKGGLGIQALSWNVVQGNAPLMIARPRTGHQAVIFDDVMYLMGGFCDDHSLADDVVAYDILQNRWYVVSEMGESMSHPVRVRLAEGGPSELRRDGTLLELGMTARTMLTVTVLPTPIATSVRPVCEASVKRSDSESREREGTLDAGSDLGHASDGGADAPCQLPALLILGGRALDRCYSDAYVLHLGRSTPQLRHLCSQWLRDADPTPAMLDANSPTPTDSESIPMCVLSHYLPRPSRRK